MHIKRIHEMIESLTECTKEAIESDQTCVGSYPIGEVVDMIKDLADAEYHARIAKAMEEAEEDDKEEEKYLLKRFKEEHGDDEIFAGAFQDQNGREHGTLRQRRA